MLESTGFLVQQRKGKIDFQHGGHLGLPNGMILAIFDKKIRPEGLCLASRLVE